MLPRLQGVSAHEAHAEEALAHRVRRLKAHVKVALEVQRQGGAAAGADEAVGIGVTTAVDS